MTKRHFLMLSIVFLELAVIVYGRSLMNDFVPFDDDLLVFRNAVIRELSPASLWKIFTMYDPELYVPLTFLSYQLDYAIAGMQPWMFHFTNLILHTGNAVLVAFVVSLLLRSRIGGIVAGLLFLLHPLHTEAVAWIAARKDVLSTFFFLGSLIAYLLYRREGRRAAYWLSLELFLFGLFAKVMVITLPVVLLLLDVVEGRQRDRRLALQKLPFFLLALVFGVIAFLGKSHMEPLPLSFIPMVLFFARSTMFYLQQLAFPSFFSVIYPLKELPEIWSTVTLLPAMGVAVLLAGAVVLRRRAKWVIFGLLFYLLTLSPTFLNLYKGGVLYLASDRYAYIPSIGIFLIVGWAVSVAGRLLTPALRYGLTAAGILLLITLGSLSYRQSLLWSDGVALFSHAINRYPFSALARNNRAVVNLSRGRVDEAMEDYRLGLETDSRSIRLWTNLGRAYAAKDMREEAYTAFEEALNIDPRSPEVHYALGLYFLEEGRHQDAQAALWNAFMLDPAYVERQADAALAQAGLVPKCE